jgi:hypothetical protein
LLALAAALTMASMGASAASLIGETINIAWEDSTLPLVDRSESVVVNSVALNPEVSCPSASVFCNETPLPPASPIYPPILLSGESIDIGDTATAHVSFIELTFLADFPTTGTVGFLFSFDDNTRAAGTPTVVSNLVGFSLANVTISDTGDSIFVALSNVDIGENAESGSARIEFNVRDVVAPVPEPGSIALLGLGLAGLFAVRRRAARSRA